MRRSSSDLTSRCWTDVLIESDRRYFAAGATLYHLPGGRLAAMPGLEQFSAGAVVLVDDPGRIVDEPHAWRATAAQLCAKRGAGLLRFYTAAWEPELVRALKSAGLQSGDELAMIASATRILATGDVDDDAAWSIREVTTRAHWREKRFLHEVTPDRPDGKPVDAASWVRLERGKVRTGYMSAWLIERRGEPCGAFGLSFPRRRPRGPALVRLKNLFVAPEHRTRGAATAALRLIARKVLLRSRDAGDANSMIGCFVLPGAASRRVYERAGFEAVGRQIEWIAPVVALADRMRRADRRAVGG